MESTLVIVGGGQAAAQAVATLRAEGFAGRIVLVSEERVLPYQRPPLSKKLLSGELDVDKLTIRPQTFFDEKSVTLRLGVRAIEIDRVRKELLLGDGSREAYDHLLLATGARARTLAIPGADLANVRTLRTIDDALALRALLVAGRRLTLAGGGYIGLEVASVAIKLGCQVTVVEREARLLRRVASPRVSAFYEAEHRRAGVALELGADVVAIAEEGGAYTVRLSSGGAVSADVVLVCVGAAPETELAERAGLTCDDGIVVDDHCRTSDPSIFAAGDCTRHPNPFFGALTRLESVPNAQDQAKCVALAIAGKPRPYADVPWFWSDQFDLKLQIAGAAGEGDDVVLRGDPDKRSFSLYYLRGGTTEGHVVACENVNAMHEHIAGRKLIASKKPISAARLGDLAIAPKDLS